MRRAAELLIGLAVLVFMPLVPGIAATGGWYLMGPLIDIDEPLPPLSSEKWNQYGAYATPEQCETARARLRDPLRPRIDASGEGVKSLSTSELGWWLSRCVTTDDPRFQLTSAWYLLLPPSSSERPLREWWQVRSYDSRLACEAHRDDTIKRQGGRTNPDAKPYLLGVCVSKDDSRLK